VFSNLALLALASFCVVYFDSFAIHIFGAIILGLFWQQCGWLAHDFLHHQVFKNRAYNDIMGIFVGNVSQGFSVQWWKSKHNAHHAVPNLEASSPESSDGDPDIDTMPILAWTMSMAASAAENSFSRFLINWQAYFYFPVLLLARISWAHQSWVFVFGGIGAHSVKGAERDRQKMAYPTLEKIALIIHYAWLFYLLSFMPILHGVSFFFVAQTSCGLFLATVFGLGHNGMAVYPAEQRPDFWKLQVSTTRNVTSNWFVDWFCGGLQYQGK
jgi:fatty acid desaturase